MMKRILTALLLSVAIPVFSFAQFNCDSACATLGVTADFMSTAPKCMSDSVSFLNTGSSDTNFVYHWDFGAGATPDTSNLENPTGIIYSSFGIKAVTFTITDSTFQDSGCICTFQKVKGITINEVPTASFTSTDSLCVEEGVDFTNTGSTGIKWSYTWDFGIDAVPSNSTAENPTGIIYSSSGQKIITFTISDGNCTNTYKDTITILETPEADFTSTAPTCSGDTVYFTNTGSTGVGYSYNWDFGADATPATSNSETPPGVVYSTFGNKKITLIITNITTSCTDTIEKPITINETPAASFTSNAPQCVHSAVDFTNTGSTGIKWSYTWDFGIDAVPSSSTAENPTGVIYTSSGKKYISFTISDGTCINTYIDSINISETPVADFTSTAPTCSGDTVYFTNTGSTGAGYSYDWDFGTGAAPATSVLENPKVIYSSFGNKTIKLIVTNIVTSCTDTIEKQIVINETPTVSFTSNAPQCVHSAVDFTNTGSTGIKWSYTWDFGIDAVPSSSTAESPTGIIYTSSGKKYISFTISDGTCTNTYIDSINISETPIADFTSTAPTCSGDTVYFTNTGSTGAGYSYDWDFGTGAAPATSVLENPKVIYSSFGNKTIKLIVTNIATSCTDTTEKQIVINETPTVGFTSTAPQCVHSAVDFTNTGSTGIKWSYTWDFGDDAIPSTSTAENPTGVIYTSSGKKYISFTISDGTCTNTYIDSINISETPVADFTSTAPTCSGDTVYFTNTGSTGVGYNYDWDFGTGAAPATSVLENPKVIYSSFGNKTIKLIVTNIATSCTDTIEKQIVINETPTVGFTSTAPQCVHSAVDFTNTGSTGIKWSYTWDFGDEAAPATSTAENPTGVIYTSSGKKYISFTISDGTCTNTYIDSINISETPVADFTSTAPTCSGDTVYFTNTGSTGAGYSYDWDFGTGAAPATSVLENPKVIYSSFGNKTIKLIVTNIATSCTDTTEKQIVINETPTVSFTSNAPQCVHSAVDFTNTGSTGIKWSYTWDFGDDAIPSTSTAENPTGVIYTSSGKKYISFTISDGTCTNTYIDSINISETPVADFTSTAPTCSGDTVYFTNTGSTGAGYSYDWDFGTGAAPATSNLENPKVIYSSFGNKTIKLIVTNIATSCTDTIEKQIVINETPTVGFTSTAPQCVHSAVDFTNTGSTGIKWSYSWDFGDDAIPSTSTAENPTGIIYTSSGKKYISFTISDGTCTNTYIDSINISETPAADFTSTAPTCSGDTVYFTNTGSTGAGYSYDWDFGTGAAPATSVLENPKVIYSIFGNKSVKLIVTNTVTLCTDTIIKQIVINETPAVSFISNAPVCVHSVVNFTNTGSTGIKWSYTWDFGDDALPGTSNAENPTGVIYTSSGQKFISFTISDGTCTNTFMDSITILETPVADFTSTAPVCTEDTIYFNNTGSTGVGLSYLWDFDSGAMPATSNLENPKVIYSIFGNKTVKLIVTNTVTLCTDTIEKSIVINETPTVSFISNTPVCAEENVNFTNTGSTGIKWSYSWDFGDGAIPNISNSENPVGIIYSYGGTKTVTLTISSSSCTNTYTNIINIYTLPLADAGLDTTICADRNVQIGSSSIPGYSYTWFPPSTLNDPTISDPIASPVANITIYSVTVTDNTTGCQNADTITVTMLPPAIADAGPDVEICFGDTIQIGTGLIEGQSYLWEPLSGLNNPFIPNPLASPDTTTLYTVKTSYEGCDTVTDDVLVTVHPLPDADAGEDVTITRGASTQLIATGGIMYEWLPQTWLDNSGVFNPVANPDTTITYIVTVTGVYGCENTDTITITVIEPDFWTPTAFTPNNDGHNDIFYIRTKGTTNFELSIFNRWNELLFHTKDPNQGWDGTKQAGGELMPEGAYIFFVKGELTTGEQFTKKGLVNLIR